MSIQNCPFCKPDEKIGNRRIYSSEKWYAFVPSDPEIFGHIIVTIKEPCIREIIADDPNITPVIKEMNEGVIFMSKALSKIEHVQRIYIAMLGETDSVHMHYHLFPRYNFRDGSEIDLWAKKINLTKGSIDWIRFYSNPTLNFKLNKGFQYLGEIERSYNAITKTIGNKPSNELLDEIAEKLKSLIK